MNASVGDEAPLRTILLTTDLSARCDRAFDRAVSLCSERGAQLVVFHALDADEIERGTLSFYRPQIDVRERARRQLSADIADLAVTARVVLGEGEPVEAILVAVEAEKGDLIVTGIARCEPSGRFDPGKTVGRLVRRSRQPVLAVRNRVRGPYRRIVVAIDFSPCSQQALELAARLFPDEPLTVFHAYDIPAVGFTSGTRAYRDQFRQGVMSECEAFLNRLPADVRKRLSTKAQEGAPGRLLWDYVDQQNIELLVMGTHGHGPALEALMGSTAKEIAGSASSDILLTRRPN